MHFWRISWPEWQAIPLSVYTGMIAHQNLLIAAQRQQQHETDGGR